VYCETWRVFEIVSLKQKNRISIKAKLCIKSQRALCSSFKDSPQPHLNFFSPFKRRIEIRKFAIKIKNIVPQIPNHIIFSFRLNNETPNKASVSISSRAKK
jgi:hypothetical protein